MVTADWTSDAVLDLSALPWPGTPVRTGPAAIHAFLEEWRSAWADVVVDEEVLARGAGRCLTRARIEATGRRSAARVELALWRVEEERGGRVARARVFGDEAAARASFTGP